jgi:hypothetical protein
MDVWFHPDTQAGRFSSSAGHLNMSLPAADIHVDRLRAISDDGTSKSLSYTFLVNLASRTSR